MEVYLTIDTECTEERIVRGRVRPPIGYDLMMRGRVNGSTEGYGSDLILAELGRYGFRATFFVEALCAEYFGIDGLAAVCHDLQHNNQDIQLHLHPNFRRPDWCRRGEQTLSDNIGEYPFEQQCALLEAGIDILVAAGVQRSSIVSFRAGNYGASNSTLQALKHVGLCIDSSLNLWALGKDCQISGVGTPNDLHEVIAGVWELPISCFREPQGYRHLEITAISAAEMRYALDHLQRGGARAATIIMHPAEFFVIDDWDRPRGRPNVINIARFRSLLAFLHRHRDRFQVRTVGQLAQSLRTECASTGVVVPRGSTVRRLARLPMQAVKRVIMRPRR